ncbi:hypothetical protein HK097_004210 [Rhizophlyctis rosea]|uniref:RING-type E3 ubiquitin transferase n=1 Tax=Rhizophlyctis rosea TaxID=64517 RepID=A0AAD5X603_9FUNG|nr:hypothetical protein HK097_004210 [Rhizophlyctis rosea]
MSSNVPCKFFRMGTCQKGNRCPFSHDTSNTAELVCTFYLRGNCKYGAACALPHSKPADSKPSSYVPPRLAPTAPVSEHISRGGSTYADYSNAILSRNNSGQDLPNLEELSLFENPYAAPSTSSQYGYRTDQPWPSDIPPEFDISDPESSDDDDGTVFYPPPPSVTSYSAAARTNAGEQAQSGVVVERTSSPGSSRAGDKAILCPFALNGNCKYGDRCRYTHGLQCPSCGKWCLHPDAANEEHEAHLRACIDQQDEFEQENVLAQDSESMECVVCLERVLGKQDARFGLLSCDHCVCLNCIRTWRTNEGMDTAKRCPICREVTHLIIPSAVWTTNPSEKERISQEYRSKLANIDCKHYNFGEGSCPFGTSCHYKHVDREGNSQEVKLRFVKGDDEEGARIVSTPKLSDFIDAWDGQRGGRQ